MTRQSRCCLKPRVGRLRATISNPGALFTPATGGKGWEKLFYTLNDNNKRWADKQDCSCWCCQRKCMPAMAASRSRCVNHSFDAGAAWASLAFQAHYLGLRTHAIGGFNREAARQALGIPEVFHVEVLIAVGRQAERETLHPDFHEREKPNGRRPIHELAAEGEFPFSTEPIPKETHHVASP